MAERKLDSALSQSEASEVAPNHVRRNSGAVSSSSIEIDQLVEKYDGSLLSKSASIFSFFYSLKPSQSRGNISPTASTTFYSALQDAFSLSDFEPDDIERFNPSENGIFLWDGHDLNDQDKVMQDVQVFWNDISLRIKPKIDFTYVKTEIGRLFDLSYFSNSTIISGRSQGFELPKTKTNEGITILNQLCGSFKFGQMTALLGPSGAGKTSLINFLSRRREINYTGQYFVTETGGPIRISTLPQDDVLPGYLTVRENLLFASRLKNAHLNIDHDKNIEKISRILGLDDCLDTKTMKISGGEQKRLAIAQELLSKPDVLILDEPTSGLDSVACCRTLKVLRDLVRASSRRLIEPIAIVLSIHQPQQEAFELFDKIYVMAPKGIAIYDGPPIGCVQFVEQHTNVRMPSPDYNPASFLIEIASGEYGTGPIDILEAKLREKFNNLVRSSFGNIESSTEKKLAGRPVFNPKSYLKDEGEHSSEISTKKAKSNSTNTNYQKTLKIDPKIPKSASLNRGGFLLKTRILFERCWLSNIRDSRYMIARFLFFLVMPLGMYAMMNSDSGEVDACPRYFAEIKLKDVTRNDSYLLSEEVQKELVLALENLALSFMLLYGIVILITGSMAVTFTNDIKRSLKEFHNGWYSMNSFLIARTLSEIFMHILLPTLSVTLVYILTHQSANHGLANIYRFLIFDSGVVLASLISQVLGMIIGAIFLGNISTALFVSQGISLPMVFLSGFVARPKNMNNIVRALTHMSFIKHSMDIAVISRYGFGACPCDPSVITGNDTKMVGVPDNLLSMVDYWMSTMQDEPQESNNDTAAAAAAAATTATTTTNGSQPQAEPKDIFQLFAKQISLYNTRGADIKTCDDMVSYQMSSVPLSDSDIKTSFSALVGCLCFSLLCLFVTVKLVMRYKTSL